LVRDWCALLAGEPVEPGEFGSATRVEKRARQDSNL
jgi:hypothetical protein